MPAVAKLRPAAQGRGNLSRSRAGLKATHRPLLVACRGMNKDGILDGSGLKNPLAQPRLPGAGYPFEGSKLAIKQPSTLGKLHQSGGNARFGQGDGDLTLGAEELEALAAENGKLVGPSASHRLDSARGVGRTAQVVPMLRTRNADYAFSQGQKKPSVTVAGQGEGSVEGIPTQGNHGADFAVDPIEAVAPYCPP